MSKKLKEDRIYVFVQNYKSEPLMPCSPAKARHLLKDDKATVVNLEPFVIRLKYGSYGYKQPVNLGCDSGHGHVGLCAATKFVILLLLELTLRTDIVENISTRRMCRNNRRYRKTRYRKPRFNNRVGSKKKGWLPPSLRYKVDKHLNIIEFISSILPISEYRVEICNFDIQKIMNPEINGEEYQHGEQEDTYNTREYVLSRDGHLCRNCFGKSGDRVLVTHHIETRKIGGDAPNNLVTLCKTCHDSYHQGKIELNIKRGRSFREAASVNSFKNELLRKLKDRYGDDKVHKTYGFITKSKRIDCKLLKEHFIDAFCIANNLDATLLNYVYKCRSFRRHNRSLHVMMFKKGHKRRSNVAKYWLDKNHQFTRYDKVICNGVKCFITGSSNSSAYIKDIDGNKTANVKNFITTNKLKKIYHAKHGMMVDKIKFNLYTVRENRG